MFSPANQPQFTLTIDGCDHDLQVLEFTGHEALNQPYLFKLELVCEDASIDLQSLLHKTAFLTFSSTGNGIHGVIYSAAQGDAGKRLTRYHVTLRPQLAYLAHRTNQRIFQHLSVPQIIAAVLEDHGIQSNAYSFTLCTPCPDRDYCVQYDESDLAFIQRLCEEEGLHYHFQHSSDGHRMVFGDDQTVFPEISPVVYQQDTGMVADTPVIKRFNVRLEARTSRTLRRDYNFEKPRLLMEAAYTPPASSDAEPDLEDYDYPGRFVALDRGKLLATRALERHRSDYELAEGRSDVTTLVSGHFLPLTQHTRPAWNDLWLLTEVQHHGKQPQVLEESVTSDTTEHKDDFHQGYRNRFSATPWNVINRPALTHPRPRILGSQSAVVTGPDGEEIHCDEYGRVKVQFFWDRAGKSNDQTSCWLRVANTWAGAKYGGIAIPRVGMEVLVGFFEGDPDQPMVIGALYHKVNTAPLALPQNKTRSVFKTLSSPGGGGYNELRIEDKKGQEQIYLHAQRDWDENIENNQRIRVGNTRHDRVEADSHSEYRKEEHLTVRLDRKVEARAADHVTIAQTQHLQIANALLVEAGHEIHLSSGLKVVCNAGSQITLKAAGSFVNINGGGVNLSGANVRVNQGGSPGVGTPAAPLLPGVMRLVDSDTAGNVPLPKSVARSGITPLCGKQSNGSCSRKDCQCM